MIVKQKPKEDMLLVGEPVIKEVVANSGDFLVPVGQAPLMLELIDSLQDWEPSQIVGTMREEYLSILYALREMGVDFRVIFAHEKFDAVILEKILREGICRLAGFPKELEGCFTSYPRDMMIRVGKNKTFLLNSGIFQEDMTVGSHSGIQLSCYGEGGKLVSAGDFGLIGDCLIRGDEMKEAPRPEEIEAPGLRVGILPSLIIKTILAGGVDLGVYSRNDHWDRDGCLLVGRDGRIYFLVDAAVMVGEGEGEARRALSPAGSLQSIRKACNVLGIVVVPVELRVLYALNLHQFPDGRVLMTGGDEELRKIVEGIVGEGKVTVTAVPIRLFPLYGKGGIRCLTTYAPESMLRLTGRLDRSSLALWHILGKGLQKLSKNRGGGCK